MRKDKSPRTKIISRYNVMFISGALLVAIGGFSLMGGMFKYGDMVNRSSSPVGTEMVFRRSNAQIEVNGIYTDEAKSVLIVRLHSEDESTLRLPYKGTDFKVYIGADSLNNYAGKQVDVLFGRYSTDGDLFLVIPKPTEDIYNVFIMNTKFVATNDLSDKAQKTSNDSQSSSSPALSSNLSEEEIQAQLAKSLNQYEYTDLKDRGQAIAIAGDSSDIIGFRVTLNPAIDTESYTPKIIKGELLKDGNFNFEEFFNAVFKESATNTIQSEYDELTKQRDLYTQRISELNDRLKENPNDTSAQNLLQSVSDKLEDVENKLTDLASQYDSYNGVQYKDSMFKNMQTKASVFPTSKSDAFSKLVKEG